MAFVDDHVQPFDLGQKRSILDDVFVRCQQDLKTSLSNLPLCVLALKWCSFVRDHLD